MSEFFKAELKDKFLEYTSERDDYFEMQLLYDEFLRPNYSLEFTEKLVREIIDYNPELLDIMSGNGSKIFMLSATAFTEEFIEEGGFKDIYIEEEEKWDTFSSQLTDTLKLSAEEKAGLGNTEKTARKKERNLLFFLIAAVSVSFLFTLFSIAKDLFFESESITKSDLEARIAKLEKENKKEKEALLKEIGELKVNLKQSPDTTLE